MKKINNRDNLHQRLDRSLKDIRNLSNNFLREGVRLSKLKHRGLPCIKCLRPTANNYAELELNRDGDGPDLCWGNCETEEQNQ